ncbi:tripartite tricarboxylate transporter TctB family protein [Mesorhizobium sp. M00.F.Ca.ET.186.01.1.1]|nr:tripartite tricarboxylate transporter TctB family protein [Mesorhizobium sp. M00.F.Ca.ET.186.01.1.1]
MNLRFDRYGSIAFALIGAFFITQSQYISTSAYGSQVGPNLFPLGLGLLLVGLSLRLFWETFQSKYRSDSKAEAGLMYKRFFTILAATLLYVLLLEIIGYVIATALFLYATFLVMGSKSQLKSLVVSLAFSVGVYVVYVQLLKGTLPGLPAWLSV